MNIRAWELFFTEIEHYVDWRTLGHNLFDGTERSWTRETVIEELQKKALERAK